MIRRALTAAAVAACLLVTGCGGSKQASKPTPTSGGSSTTIPSAAESELLVKLRSIDPGLVQNSQRAIDRAASTCQQIRAGGSAPAVADAARQRFEGGTVPILTDDQVELIVQAVRETVCT